MMLIDTMMLTYDHTQRALQHDKAWRRDRARMLQPHCNTQQESTHHKSAKVFASCISLELPASPSARDHSDPQLNQWPGYGCQHDRNALRCGSATASAVSKLQSHHISDRHSTTTTTTTNTCAPCDSAWSSGTEASRSLNTTRVAQPCHHLDGSWHGTAREAEHRSMAGESQRPKSGNAHGRHDTTAQSHDARGHTQSARRLHLMAKLSKCMDAVRCTQAANACRVARREQILFVTLLTSIHAQECEHVTQHRM